MALGYSQLITKATDKSFIDWLAFLKENFSFFKENDTLVELLNEQGDIGLIDQPQLEKIYLENNSVTIKVRNSSQNNITCSISFSSDKYYMLETYSMDELLTIEECDELFVFLHNRFLYSYKERKGIGFIFDVEGYSEDYLSVLK